MSVSLSGIDISDRIIQRGASSARMSDVVGVLVQSRDYVLRDNDGEFSPFTPGGFLFRNSWRNQAIQETEVNERAFFSGSIKSVGMRLNETGYQTIIKSRESVGTILDFVVEENDSATHSGFLVKGASNNAGELTIMVKTGTTDIPTPSLVTFTDELIPRYQINSTAGSPTNQISIDRPLEQGLSADAPIRISVPVIKTIPQAMSDALVSGQFGNSIGSTFATEAAAELAAGRTVTLHIRIEDRTTLAKHLATLLEMGNYSLTVSASGVIDIIKFPGYAGESFPNFISPSELIVPLGIVYDDSRLRVGYDLPFVDGESVKLAEGDVAQELIEEYAGKDRWQPISVSESVAVAYQYLFTDAPTADFYGQEYLDYWGAPRPRLTASLKQSESGNTLKRFQLQLGKAFAVTIPIAVNQFLLEEPCRVVGFDYDEGSQSYTNIQLEFVNFPLPNLPRVSNLPVTPSVSTITPIAGGVTVDFSLDTVGDITGELFFLDGATIVDRKVFVVTAKTGTFTSERINSGQGYKLKFFSTSSLIKSAKTDLFEFIAT